jgi:hypothetical protein
LRAPIHDLVGSLEPRRRLQASVRGGRTAGGFTEYWVQLWWDGGDEEAGPFDEYHEAVDAGRRMSDELHVGKPSWGRAPKIGEA